MVSVRKIEVVLLFGGTGLVGFEVARKIAQEVKPKVIVICGRLKEEVVNAVTKLKQEFPDIEKIEGEYGNIFVREEFAYYSHEELFNDENYLTVLYKDIFEPLTDAEDNIRQRSLMVKLIKKHRPDVVIDSMNTASGIGYQDIRSISQAVTKLSDSSNSLLEEEQSRFLFAGKLNYRDRNEAEGVLLASQAIPQLVRHVDLLRYSLAEADTMEYFKVGTAGTGGMGANMPFTHGEDRPSFQLLTKAAVAFAHTGLLVLLARSPGPVIKEIKPGALVAKREVDLITVKKSKKVLKKWCSKKVELENILELDQSPNDYQNNGDFVLPAVDGGENGFLARAEYEVITHKNLMEFVTPEDVANHVVVELSGKSTGRDVISAINSVILAPSYCAGTEQDNTIQDMLLLEEKYNIPSIATGNVGPPQIGKLLHEAYLLWQVYDGFTNKLVDDITPEVLAKELATYIIANKEAQVRIISIGIPILLPDGKNILRGPTINIPELKAQVSVCIKSADDIDTWAKKGWVDLRPANMLVWQKRVKNMLHFKENDKNGNKKSFGVSEIVAEILIKEFAGYRVF